MFSWLPSPLKRFKSLIKNTKNKSKADVRIASVIRIGKQNYACEVIGAISEKTVINVNHNMPAKLPQKIELRLNGDKTFRWVQVRWHHGSQISVKPITTWAIQ